MSVEQALSLLDRIVAQVSMTRENHSAALEALKVLKEATK